MKFSIVIPAYRANTIATAIQSICGQTWQDWELIVVGQGKDQGVAQVVEQTAAGDPRVRYLHIPKNGTCRARNAGVAATNGAIIAMIDDDCESAQDWLAIFAEYLSAHPDVGLVGGALIKPPKPKPGIAVCPQVIPSESIYDPVATPHHPPAGWDWIGCNVGIRREVYNRVGKFDEYLGPGTDFPAGEDTDYKLRLEAAGVKMAGVPRAVVVHRHGYRYGIQTVIRNARNYAYGNSGLAGKLNLLGDPRGKEWMQIMRRECLTGWLKLRPHKLPADLWRFYNSNRAFRFCLDNYTTRNGLLEPRSVIVKSG